MFPDWCPVAHPSAQRLRLAEDQRMLTAGAILLTSQQPAPEEGLGGGVWGRKGGCREAGCGLAKSKLQASTWWGVGLSLLLSLTWRLLA